MMPRTAVAMDFRSHVAHVRRSVCEGDRPEVQARHAAFKRGSAYLERYSLLIAFTAYLEAQRRGGDVAFDEWLSTRPDIMLARNAIAENPAGMRRLVVVYDRRLGLCLRSQRTCCCSSFCPFLQVHRKVCQALGRWSSIRPHRACYT